MKTVYNSAALLSIITILSGCEVVEGIFKAGVWVGVLFVVAIIALILFIISKVFKK